MTLNRRRQAILRDGRYHFACRLCGSVDYEDELDSLDRLHCVDCELLLWDSRHMVENDNGRLAIFRPRLCK